MGREHDCLQSSNINKENGQFSFKVSFLYFTVLSHLSTFLIQATFITDKHYEQ